jgi:transposase
MRQIREILRLKWTLQRSHRETARSVGVSAGSVAAVVSRATHTGLTWEAVTGLTDDQLETALWGPKLPLTATRTLPDPVHLHTELRGKGVTLELLHLEYLAAHPDGLRYSAFCAHYRRWVALQRLSMRQVHTAGEKLFVDYAGQRPHLVDPRTGVLIPVELFVAVLGASNYTYAEATLTQRIPDFLASHTRALEYFGGVSALVVPDQLRTGVSDPCRYEPGVQRSYAEWARHYGTVVLPARPAKPRDKAKVEVGVQVVERWILARLRHETFFTLDALNERIAELLEALNARPMKGYGGQSRRTLFERFDRPALQPLPLDRYVFGEWCQATVNIDYHIDVDHHLYSVPHPLVHSVVEVCLTAATVEVYHRGQRVWVHVRQARPGYSTVPEHMPKSHRAHLEWTPTRLIRWGASLGPSVGHLAEAILESRPHPEQGYRSCLGLMRLAKRHGPERLDAACARALAAGARSYKHVESILKHGLDRLPLDAPAEAASPSARVHDNVRGAAYYAREEEASC